MLHNFLVTQKHRWRNLSIIFIANKWWSHDVNLVSLLELRPLDYAVLITLPFGSLYLSFISQQSTVSTQLLRAVFSVLPGFSALLLIPLPLAAAGVGMALCTLVSSNHIPKALTLP